MGQEGDRGKSPNTTGTQPNNKTKSPKPPSEKADEGVESQRSANTRAMNPKKVTARTTKKSRDK